LDMSVMRKAYQQILKVSGMVVGYVRPRVADFARRVTHKR